METQARQTVLLPVRKGNIWRVQIVWPNGTVHHFGKFVSKEDAVDWITAHSRLTMPAEETKGPPLAPSEGGQAGAEQHRRAWPLIAAQALPRNRPPLQSATRKGDYFFIAQATEELTCAPPSSLM